MGNSGTIMIPVFQKCDDLITGIQEGIICSSLLTTSMKWRFLLNKRKFCVTFFVNLWWATKNSPWFLPVYFVFSQFPCVVFRMWSWQWSCRFESFPSGPYAVPSPRQLFILGTQCEGFVACWTQCQFRLQSFWCAEEAEEGTPRNGEEGMMHCLSIGPISTLGLI